MVFLIIIHLHKLDILTLTPAVELQPPELTYTILVMLLLLTVILSRLLRALDHTHIQPLPLVLSLRTPTPSLVFPVVAIWFHTLSYICGRGLLSLGEAHADRHSRYQDQVVYQERLGG